ncbi:MAG: hypothetical protein ACYST6_05740 [Planctomycetota bacterium]|jgi:hypothetical protein
MVTNCETTKKEATKAAKALQAKLGHPWKVRIWKNIGWHYCVYLHGGLISVRDDNAWDYCDCMISLQLPFAGDTRWTLSRLRKDPKKAIDEAFRDMEQVLGEELRAYRALCGATGRTPRV